MSQQDPSGTTDDWCTPAGLDVFELAAAGMVITDRMGRFRRVNRAFALMLDRDAADLVGASFGDITSPEDVTQSRSVMRDLLDKVITTARFEKRYLRGDGSPIWVDMNISAIVDSAGDVVAFLTQGSDISAHKAAEAELRQQAQLFSAINDGVLVTDAQGNLIDCNPAMERLVGCTREQLFALGNDGASPGREKWRARLKTAVAEGAWGGDVIFGAGGPNRRIAESTIIAVPGTSGEVIGAIAVCRDVTEVRDNAVALVDAERQAQHDARHDALTGLPNRKSLTDKFDELMSSRDASEGAALLMIDLDRFKDVNDTLGHHCGDDLLVQIGHVLQDVVRDKDTVVRLGGDEFAVLAPGLSRTDAAMALADRVRLELERPFRVQGIDLDVEASIGVATTCGGQDISALLRQADVAMYVAKRQGAGAFAYDAAVDLHSAARLSLLGELRGALTRHDLVLHFQPKISLTSGDVVGAEALVRWNHPSRGLILPDEFIPMAEHTGLIRSLTRYVLDAALAQERRWIDEGRPLPISVNLSARNLMEDRLVEQIVDLLHRHGVPPALLELEITESSIVTEPARARALLARLRALGIRVSIDDFGAGFTSLAVLKNLPISELKIDRSFVEAMTSRPSDALIVRSVVQLSHNLGLVAVAEGVEDPSVLAALTTMGCDVVQGYHFSRPLAADAFSAWFGRHRAGQSATFDLPA